MKFDPSIPIDSHIKAVDVKTPEAPAPLPAEERLTAALEKIRSYRVPDGGYEFRNPESYYEDFVGEFTSMQAWSVLACIARMLEMPLAMDGKWRTLETVYYDALKGVWNHSRKYLTIEMFKKAVDSRIAELNLAKHLVFEFMATPHTIEEDLAWSRKSFAEKMKTFQESN